MFGKTNLKNRFESLESRLNENHDHVSRDPVVMKSKHPELQQKLRLNEAEGETLSSYIQGLKVSFDRIHIREMSENSLAFENEISNLIYKLTNNACLIQIIHPMNKKGLENFKYLILALNESASFWKILLKDLSWVGVSFASASAVITFEQDSHGMPKLEGLLKSMCSKSSLLSSFNIQKQKSQYVLSLRFEAKIHSSIASERNVAI